MFFFCITLNLHYLCGRKGNMYRQYIVENNFYFTC